MPDRVFCIGNGESRKDIDLYKYKPFGKMYGCNAIYRDHPDLCDCITAVDHGITHEVYHAGMAQKIPCYFRGWTPVPSFSYDKAGELKVNDRSSSTFAQYPFVPDHSVKLPTQL